MSGCRLIREFGCRMCRPVNCTGWCCTRGLMLQVIREWLRSHPITLCAG